MITLILGDNSNSFTIRSFDGLEQTYYWDEYGPPLYAAKYNHQDVPTLQEFIDKLATWQGSQAFSYRWNTCNGNSYFKMDSLTGFLEMVETYHGSGWKLSFDMNITGMTESIYDFLLTIQKKALARQASTHGSSDEEI